MHNGRKTSDVSLFLPAASSQGSGMEEEAKPSLRTCEAKQPERPSTPDLLKILLGKQNIKTNNVKQITTKKNHFTKLVQSTQVLATHATSQSFS